MYYGELLRNDFFASSSKKLSTKIRLLLQLTPQLDNESTLSEMPKIRMLASSLHRVPILPPSRRKNPDNDAVSCMEVCRVKTEVCHLFGVCQHEFAKFSLSSCHVTYRARIYQGRNLNK